MSKKKCKLMEKNNKMKKRKRKKLKEEKLREILAQHRLWVKSCGRYGEKANFSNVDLSGANLSNSDLSYANLSNSDLSYANLSNSDLSGANLHGSNLHCTNFYCANLHNVDITWINPFDVCGQKSIRVQADIDGVSSIISYWIDLEMWVVDDMQGNLYKIRNKLRKKFRKKKCLGKYYHIIAFILSEVDKNVEGCKENE